MTQKEGPILITGGAGFIGSNLVRTALKTGHHRVVVVDKLTYAGHKESLADVMSVPRFRFVQADIADAAAMRSLIREIRPDAVLNLAAETHVDRSIDGPSAFIQTNLVGTFNLLDLSKEYWKGLSGPKKDAFRFLHVSTDEVYGALGETGAFSEETPYAPNSPYSASKAGADHLVRAYRETFGLPSLITNCSNNYGPYQYPEKLIPLVVLNALEGKPLPVYGDGGHVRDWIYVEDHCEGILAALEKGKPGEKYNLGGGNEWTNIEIVKKICAILRTIEPGKDFEKLITFVADRPGHDRRYAIDSSKAIRELGWTPAHDFEKGLRKTVEWYIANRPWCEAVQKNTYQRERLGLNA